MIPLCLSLFDLSLGGLSEKNTVTLPNDYSAEVACWSSWESTSELRHPMELKSVNSDTLFSSYTTNDSALTSRVFEFDKGANQSFGKHGKFHLIKPTKFRETEV